LPTIGLRQILFYLQAINPRGCISGDSPCMTGDVPYFVNFELSTSRLQKPEAVSFDPTSPAKRPVKFWRMVLGSVCTRLELRLTLCTESPDWSWDVSKGALGQRERTHVLTARTCGPGGNLLNAAADACPGATRPVDSSPRCAHICPQITLPGLSISPIHHALAEVPLLFWPCIVFCSLKLRQFCCSLTKSTKSNRLSAPITSLAKRCVALFFRKRKIKIFPVLN
jgi:hypothetical protein